MSTMLQKGKKSLSVLMMSLLTFAVIFFPINETYAYYRTVLDTLYVSGNTVYSQPVKYKTGGLGIKIYCKDTAGNSQIWYLQRKISGVWKTTSDARIVFCNKTTYRYTYHYFPHSSLAGSGHEYRLKIQRNLYSPCLTCREGITYIQASMNPD